MKLLKEYLEFVLVFPAVTIFYVWLWFSCCIGFIAYPIIGLTFLGGWGIPLGLFVWGTTCFIADKLEAFDD